MTELLTAAQMRAIEQAAIDSGQVTGLELMERAGRGVVQAILEEWPELATSRREARWFCAGRATMAATDSSSPGCCAERGWEVEVFLYGDPEKLPPDARVNYNRCPAPVQAWDERAILELDASGDRIRRRCDLTVDAVFGAGLNRAPEDALLRLLTELSVMGRTGLVPILAVDAPTGLCMDSGRALSPTEPAVFADLTVTFHAARPGHYLAQGPDFCGRVRVVDIGLPEPRARPAMELLRRRGGIHAWPSGLFKSRNDHKYTHGHALILSGGVGKGGAARLAARGALRIGAGLVTLGCPPAALQENAARLDAIMLRSIANRRFASPPPRPPCGRRYRAPPRPGATLLACSKTPASMRSASAPGWGRIGRARWSRRRWLPSAPRCSTPMR
jgi:NAD(P)H-hydrate repair Nnr-like enzyme with NAD(P)H-hydrate epimerase domain